MPQTLSRQHRPNDEKRRAQYFITKYGGIESRDTNNPLAKKIQLNTCQGSLDHKWHKISY
jgi:hypothetical protein